MFDYHLHSRISFDSNGDPADMVKTAERLGLREICFTDHYDFNDEFPEKLDIFLMEDYKREYLPLVSDKAELEARRHECGIPFWPHAFVNVEGDAGKLVENWNNEYGCLGYGEDLYDQIIDFANLMGIEVIAY